MFRGYDSILLVQEETCKQDKWPTITSQAGKESDHSRNRKEVNVANHSTDQSKDLILHSKEDEERLIAFK